ncbi:MAG: TolC family protein [Phycisphaerae bacterium]
MRSSARDLAIIAALTNACAISGCASLEAREEQARSAHAVERAVGVSGELLLGDNEDAAAKTRDLLADGLTADEAVQVAMLNNPRVRAAMLSINVSRADFVQSTLYTNPSLFLSLRMPDGSGRSNVEFNLAQSIAELWLVPARTRVAQRDLDRTVLEAARVTSGVVLDVRRAFVEVGRATAQMRLAEEALEITEKLVEVARLRRNAGTGSDVDVNLATASALQTEVNHRESVQTLTKANAALHRLLGLASNPNETKISLSPHPLGKRVASADSLQAIARESRLDLQVLDQSVASADALVELERKRLLRSVDVGFAFELAERRARGNRNLVAESVFNSIQSGAPTPPTLMPRSAQPTDTLAGPTLGLELPIWDQNQAQIAKAVHQAEQVRQERAAVLIDAAQDIYAALGSLQTAQDNMQLYADELVPTAQKNVQLAQAAYRVGTVPFLSVLEAQRAYLTTRSGQIKVTRDAANAEIQLEQATGRPRNAWSKSTPTSEAANKPRSTNIQKMEIAP